MKMVEPELINLKRALEQRHREYFFLFRLHRFAKPFFDHDEGIRIPRYLALLALNVALYFLAKVLEFSEYGGIIKIILIYSSIYTFFVFILYYKHKHLAYEMRQIESHISEIEDHSADYRRKLLNKKKER